MDPHLKQYSDDDNRKILIDQKLIEMIIRDLHPFSIVQDEGFVSLLTALNPRYRLPSEQTLVNLLFPLYYKASQDFLAAVLAETE